MSLEPAPRPAAQEGGLDAAPIARWRLSRAVSAIIAPRPLGGGIGVRDWVVNATVPMSYARDDPDVHLAELADGLGLTGAGVGLLTAVDVAEVIAHRRRRASWSGRRSASACRAWAAAPASTTARRPPRHHQHRRLRARPAGRAALVNAVATVDRGQGAGAAELGIAATGTATDAVCRAVPADGPVAAYGGPRSTVGLPGSRRAVHGGRPRARPGRHSVGSALAVRVTATRHIDRRGYGRGCDDGQECPPPRPPSRRSVAALAVAGLSLAGCSPSSDGRRRRPGWRPPRRPAARRTAGPAPRRAPTASASADGRSRCRRPATSSWATRPAGSRRTAARASSTGSSSALAADLVMGNLEEPLTEDTGHRKCAPTSTGCHQFRAPPSYAAAPARGRLRAGQPGQQPQQRLRRRPGYRNTQKALEAAGLASTPARRTRSPSSTSRASRSRWSASRRTPWTTT